MNNDHLIDDLYGIPAGWFRKASQHLTRYFEKNADRYPDMIGGLKARMKQDAMARKGEKAANLRVSDAPNREEEG